MFNDDDRRSACDAADEAGGQLGSEPREAINVHLILRQKNRIAESKVC